MLYMLKTLAAIEILLIAGLCLYRYALAARFKSVVDGRAVGLLLLTPVVAFTAGHIYVFLFYLMCAVAFTSRTRAEVCATYVTLAPAMPLLATFSAAGDVALVPLSVMLAMNFGALIGLAITPRPPGGPVRARYDWAVLILLVLFVYVDGRGVSATSILRTLLVSIVGFGGPYLLMSRGLSTREHVDRVLLRMGLVATTGALVGMFEMLRHWVLYQSYYQWLHVPLPMLSATLNLRAGLLRSGGPIIDYTAAGIFLAGVLVAMPYLFARFRPVARWGIVLIIVGGLVATQSRGAWVATVAGFLFLLAYRGAWAKAAGLAAAALVAQTAAFALSAGNARFAEVIGAGGGSAFNTDYRKELFWRGLDQVRAHPLFGQDSHALTNAMSGMEQGQHIVDFVNSHLYVAMVAGLPFFFLWLFVWGAIVHGAWRQRRRAGPGANLAEVPAVMVVTVMTALIATSLVDRNLLWPIIALGLASPCFALAGVAEGGRKARPRAALVARRPLAGEYEPAVSGGLHTPN